MRIPLENLQTICLFFENYLHQDWTIHGNTLDDVFKNNGGLGSLKEGLRGEAQMLIDSGMDNQHLDQIFFGTWGAGYEPEIEGFEDWRAALEEIIRLCEKYSEAEK